MVAPLIAAAARAAAKGALRKKAAGKAAKAGKTASRAKKAGDASYNARRRYYRAAERNLKKSEQTSGAESARYRELARQDFENALDTYDPANTQKYNKSIQRLANEFGVDLESRRTEFLRADDFSGAVRKIEKQRTRQKKAISESENVLESNLSDESYRSEREARAIFNSPIGSRILGGLVDVWRDKAVNESGKVDKAKIIPAILDYFNVDNLSSVIEKLEDVLGELLYKNPDRESIYESVKIIIQTKVADNTLVA